MSKWLSTKKDFEALEMLLEYYFKRYNYEPIEEEFIRDNFWKSIGQRRIPDILLQVYSELSLCSNEDNIYYAHLDNIKKYFGIDGNILEVASGSMPAFANIVAKEQLRLGSGTITLYEPYLVMDKPKYPNMKLNKQRFDSNIDISQYDLVTGILPCDATEIILESACRHQKNFYVAMCGCFHSGVFGSYYEFFPMGPKYYQELVISRVEGWLKQYDAGDLCITELDDKYEIPYPILYNKKK